MLHFVYCFRADRTQRGVVAAGLLYAADSSDSKIASDCALCIRTLPVAAAAAVHDMSNSLSHTRTYAVSTTAITRSADSNWRSLSFTMSKSNTARLQHLM
jgi:hypothetical protein